MEKVTVFLTTEVSQHRTSAQMFLDRQSAIDDLTFDHQNLVTQCGGADEFFDAVNSGKFSNIERMEINEVEYDLMTLIEAANPNTFSKVKPYLFTIRTLMDGYEFDATYLEFTQHPSKTGKDLARDERELNDDDWSESEQAYMFDGNPITCSGFVEITPAQAALWLLAKGIVPKLAPRKELNQADSVSYEFGRRVDSDNLRVTVTVNDTLIGEDQRYIISGNSFHLDSEFEELLENAGIEPFDVVLALENRKSSF